MLELAFVGRSCLEGGGRGSRDMFVLVEVQLQEASLVVGRCLWRQYEASTTNTLVHKIAPDHTLSIGHANKLRFAVSKLEMLALLGYRELLLIIHLVLHISPEALCRGRKVHLDADV